MHINVKENWTSNAEWTIQRHQQHRAQDTEQRQANEIYNAENEKYVQLESKKKKEKKAEIQMVAKVKPMCSRRVSQAAREG